MHARDTWKRSATRGDEHPQPHHHSQPHPHPHARPLPLPHPHPHPHHSYPDTDTDTNPDTRDIGKDIKCILPTHPTEPHQYYHRLLIPGENSNAKAMLKATTKQTRECWFPTASGHMLEARLSLKQHDNALGCRHRQTSFDKCTSTLRQALDDIQNIYVDGVKPWTILKMSSASWASSSALGCGSAPLPNKAMWASVRFRMQPIITAVTTGAEKALPAMSE